MINLPDTFDVKEKKELLSLNFKGDFNIVVFEGENDMTGLKYFPITINSECSYLYFGENNWRTKPFIESGLTEFIVEELKKKNLI